MFSLPSVLNRDYPCLVLSYVLENWLRKIKVLLRRVAPPPCIIWESIVGWAEIGCSDYNGSRKTPPCIIYTLDLIASSTAQSIVEESSAQCSCVSPIPLTIQVSIPTSSSCNKNRKKKVKQKWCSREGQEENDGVFHIFSGFFRLPIVPEASPPP